MFRGGHTGRCGAEESASINRCQAASWTPIRGPHTQSADLRAADRKLLINLSEERREEAANQRAKSAQTALWPCSRPIRAQETCPVS